MSLRGAGGDQGILIQVLELEVDVVVGRVARLDRDRLAGHHGEGMGDVRAVLLVEFGVLGQGLLLGLLVDRRGALEVDEDVLDPLVPRVDDQLLGDDRARSWRRPRGPSRPCRRPGGRRARGRSSVEGHASLERAPSLGLHGPRRASPVSVPRPSRGRRLGLAVPPSEVAGLRVSRRRSGRARRRRYPCRPSGRRSRRGRRPGSPRGPVRAARACGSMGWHRSISPGC